VIDLDAFLLIRIIAGDQGDGVGFAAQIHRLMRNARWNKDEIALFVDDRFGEVFPVKSLYLAFE
jgi:hypothetical protein